MHYFYVCVIPPGFVDEPPREEGHGILWAKKRSKASNRVLTGVRWSEEGNSKITRAATTKCRKCGQLKPEVRATSINRARLEADEMNGFYSFRKRAHHCKICKRCVLKVRRCDYLSYECSAEVLSV